MTTDNPLGKFDGLCLKKKKISTSNQVTPSDEGGRYDNNSMNNIIDKIVCYFKIFIKCEHSQY